jgi:hypothetical protein
VVVDFVVVGLVALAVVVLVAFDVVAVVLGILLVDLSSAESTVSLRNLAP